MTQHYPLFLDLRMARVLVVGGGAVASRKVVSLVEHGCRPEIIAPTLDPELADLVRARGLPWRDRGYEAGDAQRRQLVFAATDRPEVNAAIAAEARGEGAWVNVVDDPEASTFLVPASIREGEIAIAMSTAGASPLLARRLRERLEGVVTPGLARAVDRLRSLREEVQTRWPDDEARRRGLWFNLITQEFLDDAIEGRDEEIESRIEACLSRS